VFDRLRQLEGQDLTKLDKVLLRGVFTSMKTELLNPKIEAESDDEGIPIEEEVKAPHAQT
jgi:hypothetical protein